MGVPLDLLLVKATMFVLHTWIPILSVFVHAAEVALYAVSVKNQSTPDMSDPEHPSPGLPWYLSKGCSYADASNHGFCMQARGVFAVTCVMMWVSQKFDVLSKQQQQLTRF